MNEEKNSLKFNPKDIFNSAIIGLFLSVFAYVFSYATKYILFSQYGIDTSLISIAKEDIAASFIYIIIAALVAGAVFLFSAAAKDPRKARRAFTTWFALLIIILALSIMIFDLKFEELYVFGKSVVDIVLIALYVNSLVQISALIPKKSDVIDNKKLSIINGVFYLTTIISLVAMVWWGGMLKTYNFHVACKGSDCFVLIDRSENNYIVKSLASSKVELDCNLQKCVVNLLPDDIENEKDVVACELKNCPYMIKPIDDLKEYTFYRSKVIQKRTIDIVEKRADVKTTE